MRMRGLWWLLLLQLVHPYLFACRLVAQENPAAEAILLLLPVRDLPYAFPLVLVALRFSEGLDYVQDQFAPRKPSDASMANTLACSVVDHV